MSLARSPLSPATPLPDYLVPDRRPPRHEGEKLYDSWASSPKSAMRLSFLQHRASWLYVVDSGDWQPWHLRQNRGESSISKVNVPGSLALKVSAACPLQLLATGQWLGRLLRHQEMKGQAVHAKRTAPDTQERHHELRPRSSFCHQGSCCLLPTH